MIDKLPEQLTEKATTYVGLSNIKLAIQIVEDIISLVLRLALLGGIAWVMYALIPWQELLK